MKKVEKLVNQQLSKLIFKDKELTETWGKHTPSTHTSSLGQSEVVRHCKSRVKERKKVREEQRK
jgi:hypothetical protein